MCRILDSTQEKILKSRVQYDQAGGEKSAKEHRKDILKELTKEIQDLKKKGVEDILTTGDINEDIESDEIQQFIRENGLCELHQEVNSEEVAERDRTHNKEKIK